MSKAAVHYCRNFDALRIASKGPCLLQLNHSPRHQTERDRRIDGQTDRRTDVQTDRQTDFVTGTSLCIVTILTNGEKSLFLVRPVQVSHSSYRLANSACNTQQLHSTASQQALLPFDKLFECNCCVLQAESARLWYQGRSFSQANLLLYQPWTTGINENSLQLQDVFTSAAIQGQHRLRHQQYHHALLLISSVCNAQK